MSGVVIYIGIHMLVVAILTAIDKKKNDKSKIEIEINKVSLWKKILAVTLGMITAFILCFALLTILEYLQFVMSIKGSETTIDAGEVLMVGGALGFSLLYTSGGLVGGICAIFCFEVQTFMKAYIGRGKRVLLCTIGLPLFFLLCSTSYWINPGPEHNLKIYVLSSVIPQVSIIATAVVTTLIIKRLERKASSA